eukprot:GHVP01028667.1.p1 GENE.GHVP01028667.1~~GHVP01028667.1.p1  ORF type:complete len:234 (-),score=58.97 GHVP01028667.1:140-769(-)
MNLKRQDGDSSSGTEKPKQEEIGKTKPKVKAKSKPKAKPRTKAKAKSNLGRLRSSKIREQEIQKTSSEEEKADVLSESSGTTEKINLDTKSPKSSEKHSLFNPSMEEKGNEGHTKTRASLALWPPSDEDTDEEHKKESADKVLSHTKVSPSGDIILGEKYTHTTETAPFIPPKAVGKTVGQETTLSQSPVKLCLSKRIAQQKEILKELD